MGRLVLAILAWAAAGAACLFYLFGDIPSIPVSLAWLGIATGIGMLSAGALSPFALLPRLSLLLVVMPFLHGMEYLDFSWGSFPNTLWGLATNSYNLDFEIVRRTLFLGALATHAFATGIITAGALRQSEAENGHESYQPQSAFFFVFPVAAALFLSWLEMPQLSIFEAAYAKSSNLLAGTNFNGAWMLSYVLLSAATIDAWKDPRPWAKRIKTFTTVAASLVIIFYMQFLRGDRKCTGLIAALLGLYLLSSPGKEWLTKLRTRVRESQSKWKRILVVGALALGAFATMQIVGHIRSNSANQSLNAVIAERSSHFRMLSGTWSAVLLTPLSVAGDDYLGRMRLKWGQTYLDYLLSLPPGFIAKQLGYERPIESTHGPAWEMRYGIGGTHLLVVPYMNFGAVGVILILGLISFALSRFESNVAASPRFASRLAYASALICLPFWFWYGDMYVVRSAMAFVFVLFLSKIIPRARRVKRCAASPG